MYIGFARFLEAKKETTLQDIFIPSKGRPVNDDVKVKIEVTKSIESGGIFKSVETKSLVTALGHSKNANGWDICMKGMKQTGKRIVILEENDVIVSYKISVEKIGKKNTKEATTAETQTTSEQPLENNVEEIKAVEEPEQPVVVQEVEQEVQVVQEQVEVVPQEVQIAQQPPVQQVSVQYQEQQVVTQPQEVQVVQQQPQQQVPVQYQEQQVLVQQSQPQQEVQQQVVQQQPQVVQPQQQQPQQQQPQPQQQSQPQSPYQTVQHPSVSPYQPSTPQQTVVPSTTEYLPQQYQPSPLNTLQNNYQDYSQQQSLSPYNTYNPQYNMQPGYQQDELSYQQQQMQQQQMQQQHTPYNNPPVYNQHVVPPLNHSYTQPSPTQKEKEFVITPETLQMLKEERELKMGIRDSLQKVYEKLDIVSRKLDDTIFSKDIKVVGMTARTLLQCVQRIVYENETLASEIEKHNSERFGMK